MGLLLGLNKTRSKESYAMTLKPILTFCACLALPCLVQASMRSVYKVPQIMHRSLTTHAWDLPHMESLNIFDPLNYHHKIEMNRFVPDAFRPPYTKERYEHAALMKANALKTNAGEQIKIQYYDTMSYLRQRRKIIPNCPPLIKSLALPIDREFFIKDTQTRKLNRDDMWKCAHYLADLSNLYTHAHNNDFDIPYVYDKRNAVGEVTAMAFDKLEDTKGDIPIFWGDRMFSEAIENLWGGAFYKTPKDPYAFYVTQVGSLIADGIPDPNFKPRPYWHSINGKLYWHLPGDTYLDELSRRQR